MLRRKKIKLEILVFKITIGLVLFCVLAVPTFIVSMQSCSNRTGLNKYSKDELPTIECWDREDGDLRLEAKVEIIKNTNDMMELYNNNQLAVYVEGNCFILWPKENNNAGY